MSRAKPVRLVLCVDTLPDGPPEAPSPQPTQQPDAGLGALAERVALTLSGSEAIAPCGCRFHFFDGQPDLVMDARSRAAYVKEMRHTLRGKIAPHWHPCDVHRACLLYTSPSPRD